jgi:hypothetical protein
MPRQKKPTAIRRAVTITVVCQDDEADQADVKMTLNIDPPLHRGTESVAMTTVLAMMRGVQREGCNDGIEVKVGGQG